MRCAGKAPVFVALGLLSGVALIPKATFAVDFAPGATVMEADSGVVVLHQEATAARPYYVRPIPKELPEDGELPEAIDGTIREMVEVVEAIEEPIAEPKSLGQYKLTFYCPCRRCSGKWGYRTSSGATCKEGVTVACATIPAGTHIWIEGYGERIVQDTGAGVKGKHIDVFMESHSECLKNGVQYAEVKILR